MADDSFTSQDINELRAAHDHLVSINDPRAPKLRSFLQTQNAMGPPPVAPPKPGGLGGPPLAGLGVPAPVSIPMYNRGGQIKETGAPLSTAESLAMAPLGYISGGAEQLGRGMTQMHEAQTGSQFAGGLSDFILGGGRLATPAALPEALPAVAAAPWSSALRAMAGLGTGFGLEELNQRLVPPEYQGYGDLASTLAGIKAAQASPETLLRATKAGLSGLGAYGREIHLFKPFTPLTGLGSAWDAARASWEAGGPPPIEPLTPARTGVVAPPPVTYQKQPITPAGRVVPPPPVTYRPAPEGKPVVPPPPIQWPEAPAAQPIVSPPPVSGSSTQRFSPLPQAGTRVTPPTYPRTSSTQRFAEEAGPEAGPGPITIEGVGPVQPVPPVPPKGAKVTPAKPLSYSDASAQWHKTTQDMNLEGFPVGTKTGSWLSNRARELGLTGQSDLTGPEIQDFTNFVQGNKRLPSLEESRGLLKRR